MGQLDKSLQMAISLAVVRNAGTYYSTDCIHMGNGKGKSIVQPSARVQVRVDTAFAGGTSVEFQMVCSDTPWTDTAGTGATNVKVLGSSGAIADAGLTADSIVWEPEFPADVPKAYFGVRAVSLGTHTAGDFDANIVAGPAGRAAF